VDSVRGLSAQSGPRPHRRCGTARPDLGMRSPSRLVATAARMKARRSCRGIHAHRTAGRHCHHRGLNRAAPSRGSESPRGRTADADAKPSELRRRHLHGIRFILQEIRRVSVGPQRCAAIAGVLSAAMFMQYARGELPCPLCLLQRAALLGVCLGIMLDFRHGFSQNTGFSLLFAIFLLIVAVRQTLPLSPARSRIHWHCHLRPPHAGLVGRHRALSLDRVRREVGCHRRQRAPAPI
jgi:hypothetical protein